MDDLPHVLNPASGWMQNCNSSPYLTTVEANSPRQADFPAYMTGRDGSGARVRMSHAILGGLDDVTFEQWVELPFDQTAREADEWLDQLDAAFAMLRSRDVVRAARLSPVVESLLNWNQQVTVGSTEATVFMLWFEALMAIRSHQDVNDETLLSTLETVRNALEVRWGDWRVEWGEVNRIQRPDPATIPPGFTMTASVFDDGAPSLPHGGAYTGAGMVWFLMSVPDAYTWITQPSETTKRRYGVHGHSYVGVVEFRKPEDGGVRARSIVPFGSSRHPDSPHYLDQAALYARGELKPAWLRLEDIGDDLVRSYQPGE